MFGRPFASHQERYELGAEFVGMVKELWTSPDPIDLSGRYFRGTGCVVRPKPIQRPYPLIVNAGQSREGIAFATRHCDVIFVQGGQGADSSDVSAVEAVVRTVRSAAAEAGRRIKVILPVVLICRDTEQEALRLREEILEHGDYEAAGNLLAALTTGSESWPRQTLEPVVLGIGGFKFFGTPEQAADLLLRLSAAGVDGVQLEFWRYYEEIGYFGERVLPLLEQAGLRDLV
jgi:FMNH2-dependent dimethyl sulfone monooxygenase